MNHKAVCRAAPGFARVCQEAPAELDEDTTFSYYFLLSTFYLFPFALHFKRFKFYLLHFNLCFLPFFLFPFIFFPFTFYLLLSTFYLWPFIFDILNFTFYICTCTCTCTWTCTVSLSWPLTLDFWLLIFALWLLT